MLYTKLISLQEDGTLKLLVKSGLLSPKVFQQLEIYLWVDVRLKTNSFITLTKAVSLAEAEFGLSKRSIWRAVRAMRTIEKGTDKTVSVK